MTPAVLRTWRLQAVERLAVDRPNALLRIAEIDRALGDLSGASSSFDACGDSLYARAMARLLRGEGWDTARDARGNAPAPFFLVDNFLEERALDHARDLVTERRDRFAAAGIGSGEQRRVDADMRVANRASAGQALRELLLPPLAGILHDRAIETYLRTGPVSASSAEMDVVSYPQGGKYHPHRDQFGSVKRILTAVIYLHKEPKRFQGGDLLLHDEPEDESKNAGWFTRYIPAANSAILFPSTCLHEVTQCFNDTDDLMEGRMAINVWMYAREGEAG
jgi:hypothetical protein